MREITVEVSVRHNVTVDAMVGARRWRKLVYARQEAFAIMKREGRYSFPQIGRIFGRHHTTVMHGVRRYEKRIAEARCGSE